MIRDPNVSSVTRGRHTAVAVGAVALAVAAIVVVRILGLFGGDPTGFVRIDQSTRAYAENLLGDVVVSIDLGHDGKFFFALANDPLLLDPSTHAAVVLDDPVYRARRILYPALAGVGGLLPPTAVVWGLVVVNVVFLGIGSYATARVAQQLGSSPWLGLAFALNPGLWFELAIDGSSIVALALLMLGVAAAQDHQIGLAAAFSAGSVLAREVMLLGVFGVGIWLWTHGRKKDGLGVVAASVAAIATWSAWVSVRLRGYGTGFSAGEAVLEPAVGLGRAVAAWFDALDPDLGIGLLILVSSVIVLYRAVRTPSSFAWSMVGFALLPLALSGFVLVEIHDASRALAPLITAGLVLARDRHPRPEAAETG